MLLTCTQTNKGSTGPAYHDASHPNTLIYILALVDQASLITMGHPSADNLLVPLGMGTQGATNKSLHEKIDYNPCL